MSHRPRVTARQREQRRLRIMAMVRLGHAYEEIAREENLSRERVRQIVVKSIAEQGIGSIADHNRVQIARLEPALRLAARGISDGELRAIPSLLRVLDRMDKYGAAVETIQSDYAEIHERLMTKLNVTLDRVRAADRRAAEKAGKALMDEGNERGEELDLEISQPPEIP